MQAPLYNGVPLQEGDESGDIKKLQIYLNGIAKFYPSIRKVQEDGRFDSSMKQAVLSFQKIFSLIPNGLIDEGTFDKICKAYAMVNK
ncbi:peptidoglycan-binding protein [Akkermansia muciniphila]|uniref:peptidoglycan-binding protein n=1 Tax=Akkermansia muciniphila TaxID=239935 RepID=UPI0019602A1A